MAACSNVAGPSDSVDLTDPRLAGAWTLVSQQPAGDALATPPPGTQFTLQIADGRAAVRADCNRCGGAASVSAGNVTLGPALACTRAFCVASSPFDDRFVHILAGDHAVTLEGETLVLTSSRGIARFRR